MTPAPGTPGHSPGAMTVERPEPAPSAHAPDPSRTERVDLPALPRIRTWSVVLVALLLAAFLVGLFLLGWLPRQAHERQLQDDARDDRDLAPMVEVAVPQRGELANNLTLPGDTRAMQETAIYPRTSGYLLTLKHDIGDHVAAGELLAAIATPEIDADYKQAEAALEQAKANATKAQADLELAKATFAMYEPLGRDSDVVSKQDFDVKRSAVDQAKAALDAANANTTAANATLDKLTTLRSFERVTAPFAGTITARQYDVGALLSAADTTPGKEMFHLAQIDPLRVLVSVPQAYIAMIHNGDPATFTVRNYPNRPFVGQVVRSTGAVDPSTRTLRFELHFSNSDQALYPGMYGQVSFQVHRERPVLSIPTSALVFNPDGVVVAIAQGPNQQTVHFQKVGVGRDYGARVEITEGLSERDLVIANPGERLVEGGAITLHTPSLASTPAPMPAGGAGVQPGKPGLGVAEAAAAAPELAPHPNARPSNN